jgi:hypothetical protein
MALKKTKLSGTGKAGHRSSRWMTRAEAKAGARKRRRREDKASGR